MANEGEIKINYFEAGEIDITCKILKPDDTVRDSQTAVALDDTGHDNIYSNSGSITIEAGDTVVPYKSGVNLNAAFEYHPETTIVNISELTDAIKAMIGITEGGTWSFAKVLTIIAAFAGGDWRLSADGTKQELLDAEDGTTVIIEQLLTRAPSAGNKYRDMTVLI